MASVDAREPGGSISQHDIHSNPLDQSDSEWEYEYSATENETFYVTLDLSTADFTNRQTKITPNGRGSSTFAAAEGGLANQSLVTNEADGFENVEGDENSNAEDDGDKQLDQAQLSDDEEDNDRVQIMELHSSCPMISYRGRVFEGAWSQNVGTELLMTQHDPSQPLPILRHLADNVDLLAATSCRINVTQKELKPKDGHRKHGREDEEATGEADLLVPPPDRGATRARLNQGDFLAKFINLKKQRGEEDEVTVIAEGQTRQNSAAKRAVKPYRGRKVPGRVKRGSASGEKSTRRRGGRRPRGSDGPRDGLLPFMFEGFNEMAADSTPTPEHWDDTDKDLLPSSGHGGDEDDGGDDESREDAQSPASDHLAAIEEHSQEGSDEGDGGMECDDEGEDGGRVGFVQHPMDIDD